MTIPIESILTHHGIKDPADEKLVRVAAGAAATQTSATELVDRAEFSHSRDKAVAMAIVAAVRAGQGKGLLIAIAAAVTAVPLLAACIWIATSGASDLKEQQVRFTALEKEHAALQVRVDRQVQDYREAASRATDAALTAQKSANESTRTLAANFAQATQAQVDEIASLKAENQRLREELAHLKGTSPPGN
jgi:hypothetical protein